MEKVTAAVRSAASPDVFTLKIEGGPGAREEVVSLAGVKNLLASPALKKNVKEFYEGALKAIEAAAQPDAGVTQVMPEGAALRAAAGKKGGA